MFAEIQKNQFQKRFTWKSSDDLDTLTYLKFFQVCEHLKDVPEIDRERPPGNPRQWPLQARVLHCTRNLVHQILGSLTMDEVFHATKHGTGSSIGVPYVDTSIEKKFSFPISGTERATTIFKEYLLYDKQLSRVLLDNSIRDGVLQDEWYSIEVGSRATTVPKTAKINRMIAIEPTLNMFFQQGVMDNFYDRLNSCGLDLGILPDIHQEKAYTSSISGELATIDFSSASDCVTTDLVSFLLPPDWYWWVDHLRCPTMDVDNQLIGLRMISTMGNATTFPIETLVFWALGVSTMFCVDHPHSNSLLVDFEYRSMMSVFGDDCILPVRYSETFMWMCKSVGFLVNHDKSFTDEYRFRESCGGDFYHGRNVRPVMPGAPTSDRVSALGPWLCTIYNNLIKKYIQYFGLLTYVYDREIFRVLAQLTKEFGLQLPVVPDYFPDDSGLFVGGDLFRFRRYGIVVASISSSNHGTKRFTYYRFVYRTPSSKDEGIRYVTWLKNPGRTPVHIVDRKVKSFLEDTDIQKKETYKTRQNGSYIVASGISSTWTINA